MCFFFYVFFPLLLVWFSLTIPWKYEIFFFNYCKQTKAHLTSMPYFSQICFYTCQICFCTGVPFQTSSHLLSTSSYRSSLWSHNCPSGSHVSVTVEASTLAFKRASSRQLKRGWNVHCYLTYALSCFTSNTSYLWCQPLLECSLVLASFVPLERSCVTRESSGRKKRSAFMLLHP